MTSRSLQKKEKKSEKNSTIPQNSLLIGRNLQKNQTQRWRLPVFRTETENIKQTDIDPLAADVMEDQTSDFQNATHNSETWRVR